MSYVRAVSSQATKHGIQGDNTPIRSEAIMETPPLKIEHLSVAKYDHFLKECDIVGSGKEVTLSECFSVNMSTDQRSARVGQQRSNCNEGSELSRTITQLTRIS